MCGCPCPARGALRLRGGSRERWCCSKGQHGGLSPVLSRGGRRLGPSGPGKALRCLEWGKRGDVPGTWTEAEDLGESWASFRVGICQASPACPSTPSLCPWQASCYHLATDHPHGLNLAGPWDLPSDPPASPQMRPTSARALPGLLSLTRLPFFSTPPFFLIHLFCYGGGEYQNEQDLF